MKKNGLLMGLGLALLISFVACSPQEKPVVKVTSISLSETTLALSAGQQQRVSVFCQPDGATMPAITWTSADEAVATVATGGLITAVGNGSTVITATTPEGLTASCTVTVDSPFKNFKFSGFGVGFGSLDVIEDSEIQPVELANGSTVNCKMATLGMYAWGDGIAYAEGAGLQGVGEIMVATAIVPVIVDEGPNKGKYVGSNAYEFSEEPAFWTIIPGGLTSEEDYIKAVISVFNTPEGESADFAPYDAVFKENGATLMYLAEGLYYPIYAYATEGIIGGEELTTDGVLYKDLKLTWFVGTGFDTPEGEDPELAIWGVEINEEGAITTDSRLVTATEIYSNVNTESAVVARKQTHTLIEPGKPDIHIFNKAANAEILSRYNKH